MTTALHIQTTALPIALWTFASAWLCQLAAVEGQAWATFPGKDGPGKGKQVVFVVGDDEYRSEEGMPLLARILAERHGFDCTVLFAINKVTGVIDTDTLDNIPGLEALDHADLMVMFTRFRALPDAQMKHIIDFCDSGHGIIGLRTATHAFNFGAGESAYRKYGFNSHEAGWEGGWGRQVLGETWVAHWGDHGRQSTRGLFSPGAASSPLLRGIADGEIWVTTDVYQVSLPLPPGTTPLVLGQVLAGMKPDDAPAAARGSIDKNAPMMPVAWTRTYTGPSGRPSRVFTTTMGGGMAGRPDWDCEALRRLLVNAVYWGVGLEDAIPAKAEVAPVGANGFKRGVRPQDVRP
ncbi:MAG: ThuA domain-containing protein [Planctomycetes bacterium]|nr:ThuA domain-containing protein [Planctomycetota bacterium]